LKNLFWGTSEAIQKMLFSTKYTNITPLLKPLQYILIFRRKLLLDGLHFVNIFISFRTNYIIWIMLLPISFFQLIYFCFLSVRVIKYHLNIYISFIQQKNQWNIYHPVDSYILKIIHSHYFLFVIHYLQIVAFISRYIYHEM